MTLLAIKKGDMFHRWTFITLAGKDKSGRSLGKFICQCGNTKQGLITDIKTGRSKSCGCLTREVTSKRTRTHGRTGTPLYKIWLAMKNRCTDNSKSSYYQYYCARGIKVDNKWLNNFPTFENWANENGYKEGLQLDRIDNNKGYSPCNCRFITPKKNCQNTRKSKVWHILGKTYFSCREAAEANGVTSATISRWCNGRVRKNSTQPPKKGCFSRLVYECEK